MVKKIVIATSTNPENEVIRELAARMNIGCYSGSEEDVLDRYYQTAKMFGFDIIVRITGDCPLHDPKVVDDVIKKFLEDKADYTNNVDPPSFPDGFDMEVFTFKALEKAHAQATVPHHREHVTAYIRETNGFKKTVVKCDSDLSKFRFTVDTSADYFVAKKVVEILHDDFLDGEFSLWDIIEIVENDSLLVRLNTGVVRDEKYLEQKK